ncbi:Zn-ribbon domain-containing OB-fold protein [Sphingobium sp. Z007]|uniref:Zn-ribbon domain-containing OB-fold protein n=1 Tax=Sphingobium sp. Z007 TaxID=627495 RepID=UPI000B4A49B7|nr:OB-fold domain-containing protein [Sphingobium sp. Z007]
MPGSGTITDIASLDSVAVADGLFAAQPQPHLIGGRDRETGRIVFPCPVANPRFEEIDLPPRGRVWSWTIQRFRPKTPPYIGPEAFEPFAIGYVELPGAVIVETRIVGVAFDAIRIGMEMETVIIPFATDASGRTVVTYAFAPFGEDKQHG